MKLIIVLNIVSLAFFGVGLAGFDAAVKPTIAQLQNNRQETTRISDLARDIATAKAGLAQLTPERRAKLTQALPTAFDVNSRLTAIASSHNVTASFTPKGAIVASGQTKEAQELTGTLKVSAPTTSSLQAFLADLEQKTLFVAIKKLTIAPFPNSSGFEAVLELGVYVQ